MQQIQQFALVTLKGNIEEGYLSGEGERYVGNTIVESGNFVKGVLNGKGKVENHISGTTKEGVFKDGVLQQADGK